MKNVMLAEPSTLILLGMGLYILTLLAVVALACIFAVRVKRLGGTVFDFIFGKTQEEENLAPPHLPIPPVHPASGHHRFKMGLLLLLLACMTTVICFAFLPRSHDSVKVFSQSGFFDAVESNRIVSASIVYDTSAPPLARITGTYKKCDQFNHETEVPFVVEKILLTEKMRDELFHKVSPIEVREPYHFVANMIWTIAPFFVVVVIPMGLALCAIILFFFVIRRTSKNRKSTPAPPTSSTQTIPRKCPQCGAELKPDVSEGLCPACLLQRGIATEGGAPPGTPPFTPPTIPDLARLFPQLEILELIGKGGMGAVYKARQPALDRFVALKILAPRSGGDLDFAERFTREARALAKLSHPNIVAVYDFGQVQTDSGRAELPLGQDAPQRVPTTPIHFFIMEHVDGPNLRQVEQAGRLSPREALEIIPQICGALQFAHDEGIVHRDIKPENVLLDKKGRVKIADFGLAKIMGSEPKDFRLTGARDVVGTPHYMAPEQIEKPSEVDHRADIYSLGVVFYEMLTGELPLGKFQPPSSCARGMQIDVRLDEVVLHALEKEPARRYQQVSEVKTRVETIAMTPRGSGQESAPSESQNGLAPTAVAPPLRRGVRTGLGVFLAVVILTTGITFLLPESYVGIARVKLASASQQNYDPYRVQTEFEVIESSVLLKPVADSLNLGGRWKKMVAGSGGTLPDDEVVELMKRQLALQPLRNTSIFEIRYYSQSPKEAAEIANKISEVYCALPPGHRGEIIDPATVPLRPVKPNRPLNLFIGVVAGVALGIFTGVAVGLLAFWRGRAARRAMSLPPMQKPDRFWRWFFAVVIACLIFIPVAIAILGLLASIAIPNFVKARQQSQQNAAQQWTREGWQLWQAQKMDQAAAKFQQAIQLTPDNADAWNGLGWATFNSGETQEAEQAFQKAISLDTNQPGALNGLGQIYLSQRLYDQAETYLLKAAPQAPASWYGLTRLYLLEGKFDQAGTWAQKVVDSGQADDLVRQMLRAAQEKHLSEALRSKIEPPPTAKETGNAPMGLIATNSVPASAAVESTADSAQTLAEQPPVVVETWPVSGARDVEPGVAEIRVRFSKEMTDGGWSWSTAWENSVPESIGDPHYEAGHRTCVLKAKLEPGRTYAWWLNSGKFHGFTDLSGRPAVPYLLIFQTKPN